MGRMNFDDLQGERGYSRWGAYGQSKLANLLFAFELNRRLRAAGSPVASVAAHPGYAATNLQFAEASKLAAGFMAVGMHYLDFRQTSDAEVQEILEASRAGHAGTEADADGDAD